MAKVTKKEYYCPVCGEKRGIETNHSGEVYSGCSKCGNRVMYCSEGDNNFPDGEATIRFYWFDVSKKEEKQSCFELKEKLEGMGYKVFNTHNAYKSFDAMKKHDGEVIKLRDIEQFDNQIVSSIGRVFYWFENMWPNEDIESGYYLEDVKKY